MSRVAVISPEIGLLPFSGSSAIAAGHTTRAALKSRAWQRLFHDVYVTATEFDPYNHLMWCNAAGLMLPPGAALGGWSAALAHGAVIHPPDAPVWVSLPLTTRMRPRNRLLLRRTPLTPDDLMTVGRLRVTSPVRTAFDLGRQFSRTDSLIALDAMCHQLVLLPTLEEYATVRWSWPYTRQFRELLPLVEPLAESPMETRVRLILIDGKLPRPTAQCPVYSRTGVFVGRADLGYQEWRIAIEYEGDYHREQQQYRRDVARTNAMNDAGWLVLRFTADDVFKYPDRLLHQVRRAIAERQA